MSYKSGASFILSQVGEENVFIPEECDESIQALGQTTRDFFNNDVWTKDAEIEKQVEGVSAGLLKKAGEIGLLMAEVPENYGGLGLSKVAATCISENTGKQGSFMVSFMCHTGIGTLPILYYGTEAQKQKYLPKLATGEWIGAYALTESGSGSDALGAKCKAVLSEDGKHYILNGEKMFITNGAWADVITVFAKVDGDKFTGFIVETNTPGVSHGPEEQKMGIKGSSTTTIILEDAKISVENVLGEIGKGHKIAFNVLNVGRWKLGAGSIGSCKELINYGIKYCKERKQFNTPLTNFELIKEKIASNAIKTFVSESVMYRYADDLDQAIATLDQSADDYYTQYLKAVEEYAIEASICKVLGSEVNAFVADETVQMLGGYGFIQEYPVEAHYRNCRITRIFEGTNEINRMIIPSTLLKRAMAGQLDLMTAVQSIVGRLKDGFEEKGEGTLANEINNVNRLKKLAIYASGIAVQKHMADIKDKQSYLLNMADLVIQAYACDTALARVQKLEKIGHASFENARAAIQVYITETCNEMVALAKQFAANLAAGDETEYQQYSKAIDRILAPKAMDTRSLRLKIADHLIEKEGYSF